MSLLLVVIVSTPMLVSADTFIIESTVGTTTTKNTIKTKVPNNIDITVAINDLISEIGGNADTLEIFTEIFDGISSNVVVAISSDPLDIEALTVEAKKLVDLALRLQVFILKDKLVKLTANNNIQDAWFTEILNNF